MQAFAQNAAIGATLVFLTMMVLRQVPVLGFFVRLATRVLLLVSPVMVIVLVVAIAWFHGASLIEGDGRESAPREVPETGPVSAPVSAPVFAPLPAARPDE